MRYCQCGQSGAGLYPKRAAPLRARLWSCGSVIQREIETDAFILPVRRAERDVGVQVLEVVVAVQAFACLGGGQCDERHAHLLAADGFNAAQAFLQQDIAPVQVDAVGRGCLQLMLEFFVNGKITDVDGAADLVADITREPQLRL